MRVQERQQCVAKGVGLFDATAFTKHMVKGPGATAFLDWLTCNKLPRIGRTNLTYALTDVGTIRTEMTIVRKAEDEYYVVTAGAAQADDIVDIAVSNGSFNPLVAAVQAADLVDVLKSDGPFTVFAPTDEAFAALPAGTVESLLLPENKEQLIAVLTYHVVPGTVMASDVMNKQTSATTVQGSDVRINALQGGVKVDGANVVAADIIADNGVIHVIDKVILP